MLPLIRILSTIAIAIGGITLYWYEGLTRDEQQEADRLAARYARDLYGKGLDQLTKQQFGQVTELVEGHYAA